MSDGSRISNPYPKDPENVDLGPMTGGMVRNKQTTALEKGESLTLKNLHAEPRGAARRPGSIAWAGGVTVSYAPVRDLISFFRMDGSQRVGVLDAYFLYLRSGNVLVRQGWTYSTGTIRTSGAHVFAAGANFSSADIRGGDFLLLKPGASQQEIRIATRNSFSHLLLTSSPSPGPYAAGTAFRAYRAFGYSGMSEWVDWTIAPVTKTSGQPKIALADYNRPLFSWDGGTLGAWSAALTFIPKAVCFFQDRLFCLNTIEGANTFRRRIRWSKTTDSTSFIASPDTQWIDRPYGNGEGMRLIPFGKLLAVFYSDGIDVGRPTNYAGDVLPLSYEQLNTGGAGLVGMKAVKRFYDGIFCVLDDGIYFLDNNGFQNIGEPIWKYATDGLSSMKGTFLEIDWKNRSIVFGLPLNDGTSIGSLWIYNYETKKWSWDDVPCTMLGSWFEGDDSVTWDGAVGTWDAQTATWNTFASSYRRRLMYGRAGALNLFDPSAGTDTDGSAISCVMETGDIEFGISNYVKTVFRLVLELDGNAPEDLPFIIEGSWDRGTTWKALGTLTIAEGADKNQTTFKLTGHMLRFRVTYTGSSLPFVISAAAVNVRVRGREVHFGG